MVQRLRDAVPATDVSLCYPSLKAVVQNKGGDTLSLSKLDGPNPRVGWVGVHTKSHIQKTCNKHDCTRWRAEGPKLYSMGVAV